MIIIGGGVEGVDASSKASKLGAKAVIINGELPIGGSCVNVSMAHIFLTMSEDIKRVA